MRMAFEEWFFSNKEKIIDLYNKETDPNYECKVAYYTQGKTIQIRHTPESEWVDLKGEEPKWHSCYEYRVKPGQEKRRKTNRELAQWVWQGNGQVKYRDGYYTLIACTAYDIRDDMEFAISDGEVEKK